MGKKNIEEEGSQGALVIRGETERTAFYLALYLPPLSPIKDLVRGLLETGCAHHGSTRAWEKASEFTPFSLVPAMDLFHMTSQRKPNSHRYAFSVLNFISPGLIIFCKLLDWDWDWVCDLKSVDHHGRRI